MSLFASPGRGVQIGANVAAAFVRREAGAVAQVVALVRQVVGARGYAIPPVEREDVVQDTLLQLWSSLGHPAGEEIRSFGGFVSTVAHRRCIDWTRRRHLEARPVEDSDALDGVTPESAVLHGERLRLGGAVLARMRPACRELIRLLLEEGLSYRTIARGQGRSEGALRVQMCKCLKRAREEAERLTSTARDEP